MGDINVGRWILGGLIAGVVLYVIDFILNGLILGQQWNDAMVAAGQPPITQNMGTLIFFFILDLLIGLTAVWVYAAIRPRFGAGIRTAVFAGLAVWVVGYLVPSAYLFVETTIPAALLWATIIVGIVQVPLATAAGAYFYQE